MGARLRSQIRGNSVSTLTMNLTMRLGVRFPSLHYQLVAITELSQLTCCFRMVDSQTLAFLSFSPSLFGQWHNLFVKHFIYLAKIGILCTPCVHTILSSP